MPLNILLPMVIVGIAGIVVLLHLLGLSKPTRFDSEAAARVAWLREFPGIIPTRIYLCQNKGAALIETPHGYGIVWAIGSDSTARDLHGARMVRTGTGIRIDLPDYTAPRIDLRLGADEVDRWAGILQLPA